MANSFKQMCHGENKIIRRTDTGMFIALENIHVKPDFNRREDDERTRQADDDLYAFLMAGGTVPPLECVPRDEGGVWIVEGHRRQRCYIRCQQAGKPIKDIQIVPFTGNDVERIARIMTSNNQLPLSKIEQSAVVKDLAAFNLTTAEIAKLIHKSIPTVEMLMTLSTADHAVKEMVKAGDVSAAVVVDRIKEHGESAAQVVQEDVKAAKAAGIKKVTNRVIKPEISAKRARELVEIIANAGIDDDGTIKLDGLALINAMAIIADHTGIKDNR